VLKYSGERHHREVEERLQGADALEIKVPTSTK
jgi:hypothetical protein